MIHMPISLAKAARIVAGTQRRRAEIIPKAAGITRERLAEPAVAMTQGDAAIL
ncbi:MAG: hypothetical protein NTV97_12430 [Alphaproteobacteria bacterium]|nr:hypothetical protein [Alphaproteobacteria bacterium]